MRRFFIILILAFLTTSCDRDCEAFDTTREIAKWHLFPELDQTYIFYADDQERAFMKIRGNISEMETVNCAYGCSCTRGFSGEYSDEEIRIRCSIAYDPDNDPQFRLPIFYEFDGINISLDVTPAGELFGSGPDTTSTDPMIEFENLDSLTLNDNLYQDLLHLKMPEKAKMSDYWIARGIGLVAFQEDSVLFVRK